MEESDCSEQVSIEIEELNKLLACSLRERLRDESPLSENCIFKVPWTLRQHNEASYEPKIVSIGPFHRRKNRLEQMEKVKIWNLNCLLARLRTPPEESLQVFVGSIRKLAKRTRNCYGETIDLSENELVEVMIVDGCFILELFRKDTWLVPRDRDDPVYKTSWMYENLYHDLILLENQIPWFILECLFNLTPSVHEQQEDFLSKLVLNFFETMMLMMEPAEYQPRDREIKHILDLLRNSILSSSQGNEQRVHHRWEFFPPVTDLLGAGVKFKKGTPDDILNIKFSNGVFKIPPIRIQGNSESLFRNLIAYEQCECPYSPRFTSYAVFLDCLINTSKDADLLVKEGILVPRLSTEDLATLFNRLYNGTLVYDFYYGGVARKINEYQRSRWPKWKAMLRQDYFNNPWSISSFIAAIVLLCFSFLQTLFTILSYKS